MPANPALPPDTPLFTPPRAVLVGASSGIGAALARALARQGYYVALLARREAALQKLRDEINETAGGNVAFVYPHDVNDFNCIPAAFQKVLQDLKRIDLVVYNAGVMMDVMFSEYDFSKDRSMVETNLLGAMAWLGLAATLFERQGSGHIVGISSVAGDRGRVKNPGYNASKAGLSVYLEALRNRLSRKGVHVLTVKPGPVDTAMTAGKGGLFLIPPEQAARDIVRAVRRRKQILYTPARWQWIMLIVRHIPSVIFRRLKF